MHIKKYLNRITISMDVKWQLYSIYCIVPNSHDQIPVTICEFIKQKLHFCCKIFLTAAYSRGLDTSKLQNTKFTKIIC